MMGKLKSKLCRYMIVYLHMNSSCDNCTICLEPLNDGKCVTFSCSHSFHSNCMEKLRNTCETPLCPLCRCALPPGNMIDEMYRDVRRKTLTNAYHINGHIVYRIKVDIQSEFPQYDPYVYIRWFSSDTPITMYSKYGHKERFNKKTMKHKQHKSTQRRAKSYKKVH